jgi:isoprenylcysteine carboxyl methyltransferase (ICMT) family protein YpbQ
MVMADYLVGLHPGAFVTVICFMFCVALLTALVVTMTIVSIVNAVRAYTEERARREEG